MDPERWRQVEQIYCAALEREPAERGVFLREACAGDAELLYEVESLLAQDDRSNTPLDRPAWEQPADLLDDPAPTELRAGAAISHYRIVNKLGEGGMGVVYRAEDTVLRRIVALKFLPGGAIGKPENRSRFLREAQASAMIDHPNVCPVYEFAESGNHVFLAMAYVEGTALSSRLAAGLMSLKEGLEIAIQIGEGLRAADNKRIVHRDIKPGNILITTEGQVRITDFGLALLAERTRLTKPGTIQGTAAYMSPEQALGKPVDRRSDIWSLGVVLYEMVTGKRPFLGNDVHSVLMKVVQYPAPEMKRPGEPIPSFLKSVVQKTLAKNPAERFQHIDDLLVDLRAICRTLPESSTPPQASGAVTPTEAVSSTVSFSGTLHERPSARRSRLRAVLDYVAGKFRS